MDHKLDPEVLKKLAPNISPEITKKAEELKEFFEQVQQKAKRYADQATKKHKEIVGIALLPPKPKQICPKCGSEEIEIKEGRARCKKCGTDWPALDLMILLQLEGELLDQLKTKQKIEKDLIELRDKQNFREVKIVTIALAELWDACLKGKYDILGLITISAPIYDSGWLGALRAVELHKTMVLKELEKYVVCYVLAGSMVRGTATKDSDIDTFVVIDDTDVTRMTEAELKSRLRSMIWGLAAKACMAAGVKNKLNVQVYLLTEMWDSIKNSNPVIFTFLRDGVPLYDRGMFAPWKLLLKKGKVTPTPEAVENYLKSGKEILKRTKWKLKDIAVEDFFWATLTPSQGVLMAMNVPPPAPSETPGELREHLVKRGLLEEKWVKILEEILKMRKDIEHGKIEEVSAKQVDELLTKAEKYLARLDKLVKQIESIESKKAIKSLYEKTVDDILAALKMADIKVRKEDVLSGLQKLVKAKLAPSRFYDVVKQIFELKKKGRAPIKEIASLNFEESRLARSTFELIRAHKAKPVEKFKLSAVYNNGRKKADIWLLTDRAFVVFDTSDPRTPMKKYEILKDGGLRELGDTNLDEINNALEKFTGTPTKLTSETIKSLKKILAEDMQIVVGA